MSEEENYPDSAISSWSGFVYQGKIALFQCLKLILKNIENFELQLDSTDDFAIYKDSKLLSAHQVKAKVSKYRSIYQPALEKSAKIELDRIKGTTRYFHISVQISDMSDYKDSNDEVVKFYDYEGKKYCGLSEIEGYTKSAIKDIFKQKNIESSEQFVDWKYCLLSEMISTKAINIHKKIQEDGDSERKAAYENRISSEIILNNLINNDPYSDKEHYAIELRSRLHTHLEEKIDQSLQSMTDSKYERARKLYEHIRVSPINELERLCQLIKPSERFSRIQKQDIRKFTGLIQILKSDPILKRIPHYLCKKNKFYIPTAIDINEDEDQYYCILDIQDEMKNNPNLLELLYEYNNLIAYRAQKSFFVETKYTIGDGMGSEDSELSDSHITRKLNISVITKEDVERHLND